MKKFLLVLFITVFTCALFATIPPKKGVQPPPGFSEFNKNVQKEYSHGYYAQKFRLRKQYREEIARGLKPESILQQDTVFALTLMGQYPNLPSNYPAVQFQDHLFDGPNPTGTIKDYYSEISYNQLYFDGHCEGWYNVPGTLESYVGENSGLGPQGGPRFVLDLIQAADPTFNFSDYIQYYDAQNRPHIGFVAVIHTGAGAEAGAYNIWSHRWTFGVITNGDPYITNDIDPVSGQNVLIDGDYAIEPEMSGSSNIGGPIIEIGVFTHEFGHIFGLPDLYDTDNSSEGLGNWCLMAGGSWGGNGNSPETPCHMSAWCKKELGWVTPVNITTFMEDLTLPEVEENPVVYQMWRNGTPASQYFLAENRQKTGFDINLLNSGMLIFHVDESQSGNQNEDHYLVDLEQADGFRNLNNGEGRGDEGDPFPGSRNNKRFDINTNPNSSDYDLASTFVSVRNIRKDNMNMIGDFDIGTKPYIEVDSVTLTESIPENGRVGQGESGTLNFSVRNIMPANSENTAISITIDEPGIQLILSGVFTSVNGNSSATLSIPSAFTVDQDFISRTIRINYTIAYENRTIADSVFFPVGVPEILLLSRADKPSIDGYYKTSLDELDRYYEDCYNSSPVFYSQRKAIIVLTGKTRNNIFTNEEIDSLAEYINNGGRIFFSGQNAAEYLHEDYPEFLNNVVGIDWLRDQSVLIHEAFGRSGDPFGEIFSYLKFSGNDGANIEADDDVITSLDEFQISLTYKNNGSDPAGGWIIKPNGAKIFFLGFGFESINNNLSDISRTDVMDNIMQWFAVPATTISDRQTKIFNYKLDQNYPNPFNPSTNISFEISKQDLVSLKVYNLLGEQVSTLVNEEKSAGRYTIQFNAAGLPSGIYFYKLNAGTYSDVRKMIILK